MVLLLGVCSVYVTYWHWALYMCYLFMDRLKNISKGLLVSTSECIFFLHVGLHGLCRPPCSVWNFVADGPHQRPCFMCLPQNAIFRLLLPRDPTRLCPGGLWDPWELLGGRPGLCQAYTFSVTWAWISVLTYVQGWWAARERLVLFSTRREE